MKKLILILACLLGCASAQYITVTASGCIGDGTGALLANGVLTIVGTDQNNRPIPYRAGSSSQATVFPITRGIAAGSLTASLQLADPTQTSPTNIRYHFTIQNNATKQLTDYPLIMLTPNDVFVTSAFTQFNICKMNPLPNTTSIMAPTATPVNSGSELITGDLEVQGKATLTGASSKLGIGTISPSERIHVLYNTALHAGILIEGGSAVSPAIEFKDGAGTPNRWWTGTGQLTTTDGKFFIYDARQALMRFIIDTNGKVNIVSGILPNGGGSKHIRVASCSTAAAAGATCNTIVTWPTQFVDANYTATCTIELSAFNPYVVGTFSKAAATIGVQIAALNANVSNGIINCIAEHD